MKDFPKEFAFLQRRKRRLKKELARIEAMEANLLETRQLLHSAMQAIGVCTTEEFATSESGQYMRLFLDNNLALTAEEIKEERDTVAEQYAHAAGWRAGYNEEMCGECEKNPYEDNDPLSNAWALGYFEGKQDS
jgi:hypothetical protein